MPVYVDPAVNPFHNMIMGHMWSESLDELFEMADRLGLQRSWLQTPPKASWTHFDISKSKRLLAIRYGAITTDKYGPIEHVCRLRIATGTPEQILISQRKLESIAELRRKFGKETQGDLFA